MAGFFDFMANPTRFQAIAKPVRPFCLALAGVCFAYEAVSPNRSYYSLWKCNELRMKQLEMMYYCMCESPSPVNGGGFLLW